MVAGGGVRIFKVNGQMYYQYAPTLQHVPNTAKNPRPVFAQLYALLDKDKASRHRFETLLAMRNNNAADDAYAVEARYYPTTPPILQLFLSFTSTCSSESRPVDCIALCRTAA